MNENLATNANLAMYSAMAVITLSMLAYALYLAGLVPARTASRDAQRSEVLVGAEGETPSPPAATPPGALAGSDEVPLRARKAGAIAQLLAGLGALLLVASVALRGLAVHRWPLGNMYEFGTFAAMSVMVFFVAWSTRRDLRWLGLFITAPVLLLCGLTTTVWYTQASGVMPALQSYWLVIHVTIATISVSVFTLGAAVAVLSLVQARVETSGKPSLLDRLPSSKALERMAYGFHVVGFPLWTFTVIAGAIWARQAWGSYWNWDPKEVWSFIIWVVYAAYLHARATSGMRRTQATWIALAGFACIIVNYAIVNVYFVSQHSYSGL
ncbi:putative cytochrome C assembly protein [Nostocoides japonicum T1-X7]|uniref:Putative cytochrome C assembly protein n=1 Tax=Nostocoides japonicum T1-X7 TaxID=1194083 RepID=A0A077LYQ3_9MICO|nr:c-type cytochrome biogenesis protein CcsB [Tetrasphaera japonica]CCH77105.1 putative cytochrome C assembly protein [Tetrasphaera japonica T1-X7]